MRLIDCPECGHRVSDAAETCPSCGVRLTGQAAHLQLQLELSQIDLEWERQRAKLMVGTWTGTVVPRKRDAVLGGLFAVALGVGIGIWLVATVPAEVANIAGIVTAGISVLIGLGMGMWAYAKAEAYEEAEAAHLRKKEAARSKHEGQAEGQS